MSKSLVITEKPSVARDIVSALGGFEEHEGYWEREDLVVTFAVGHLFELLAPEDLDVKFKRWTLDTLPIIPEQFELKPKKDHMDRQKTIQRLLKREDLTGVINACDAGREGELIFREIVDYNDSKLPIQRLWLQSMTAGAIRQGFADLKPGEQYRGLRDAAYCRTYSDWLIGMNATRALTRRLKTRSENQAWSAGRVQTPTLAMLVDRELEILSHTPVPYWKVLGTFSHQGSVYQGTWFDRSEGAGAGEDDDGRPDRIFDEAQARAILARIEGKPALASESRKPSKETAPPLFDLTGLQREANRRFGWSARRTLNAAQRCYEVHKTLTYPRTDARALPNDYRPVVDEVISALSADPRYNGACKFLKGHGLLNTGRIFDDSQVSDHFAIVPTGSLPERALEGDDARLFDLVTRRFLAAFHPAATWSRVERITMVEGDHFRSRARTLQDPGWRAVLGETESEESEGALPPLIAGQDQVEGVSVNADAFDLASEETKPPPRINEGRLLSLMENAGEQVENEEAAQALKDKGIGTPATRADIIENLISKGYVVRAGKALRPSVKGIRLIDILHRMHADRLASPRLTGEMEQHLSEVEKKKRAPDAFMDEIRGYTREIVDRTKSFEFDLLYPDDESLGACPLCSKPVFERSWFYRCKEPPGLAEARRPAKSKAKAAEGPVEPGAVERPPPAPIEDCPFRIWKDKSGRYIDRTTVRELLQEKKTRILDGFTTRQGRTYRGQLLLEGGEVVLHGVAGGESDEAGATETPEYEVDDTPLLPCPACRVGEVVETRSTFICSQGREVLRKLGRDEAFPFTLKKREIPEGLEYCPLVLPRTVCRREITREEATTYLREGKTPLLTDFISKKGRPFSAILFLRPESSRHGFEFPPRGESKKGEGAAGAAGPRRGGRRRPAKADEGVAATKTKAQTKAKAARGTQRKKAKAAKPEAPTKKARSKKAASGEGAVAEQKKAKKPRAKRRAGEPPAQQA